MKVIEDYKQLILNIESVENYLVDGTKADKKVIRQLIRKGRCFVAYKVNQETRFAPRRFLGYVNHDLNKHELSNTKDGKETNKVISKVFS